MSTISHQSERVVATESLPKSVSNRSATVFVWSVWAVMLLVGLVCAARYGRNLPLAEDWLLVPPLTGHEPNLAIWLWEQNNEHRVPLPRLILLLLLKMTGGDFRAGMFFNIVSLAALAGAMIQTAKKLRGRTTSADAFFPIALLHLGNWENLVWSWQLSFVVPTLLTCVVLLMLVDREMLFSSRGTIISSLCLVLLPLCGANGLVFVPVLALCFGYFGFARWRSSLITGVPRWGALLWLAAAASALILCGVYFIGYVRPWWNPPNPGVWVSLKTSVKFLALGFGPAAAKAWKLWSFVALGALLLAAAHLTRGALYRRGLERLQAVGLLLFLGGIIVLALGIGWGRAAHIPRYGLPMRYVLLSVPALCLVYFVSEIYDAPLRRRIVQACLLVMICIVIPSNTWAGFRWRDWYVRGASAFERDVKEGIGLPMLAERHRAFLMHWNQKKLEAGMRMLRQSRIGVFGQIRDDSSSVETAPQSSSAGAGYQASLVAH